MTHFVNFANQTNRYIHVIIMTWNYCKRPHSIVNIIELLLQFTYIQEACDMQDKTLNHPFHVPY